jgi:hypothetical protein
MAIDITNLDIQDEFGNAVTDFSLLNVTDKVTLTYEIEVSEYAIASNDVNMIMNYTNGVILGGGYWLYDPQGQFTNFKIGDVIERKDRITNAVLNATINVIDKLDNFRIKIDVDLDPGFNDVATSGSIFNIKTPITALKYFWNFIENTSSNDYFSKVDGSLQLLSNNAVSTSVLTSGVLVSGVTYRINDFNAGDDFTNVGGTNVTGTIFTATGTTPTTWSNGSTLAVVSDLEFQGLKPYQIGSGKVCGNGVNSTIIYGQKFIITHETYLTPFILANQVTDLENGINPSYFLNGQALKNIFKIEAMYLFNDPNRIFTYESSLDENLDLIGNTGGYNENFNTGITNYFIDSVDYANNAIPTATLELTTAETDFSIVVKNTIDTPFSNNNTKYTIGFVKVPFDVTEYQGNARTLAENFCFDRLHSTVGSAAINGETFGTDYQVFKQVSATFTNSGQIVISGKVLMDANVVSIIQESDVYKYLIFVSVQDHTKTSLASNCDRVTMLADINDFYVDASDPTMVVQNTTFIEHPYTDIETQNTPSITPKVEDEIAAIHRFYIDTNGREDDEIVITSIEAKVVAYDESAIEQFTLDSYTLSMVNMTVINGAQYVNLDVPRVFHIEEGIRKNVQVKRRTDLDATGFLYYDVVFPFVIRYEYWLALQGVNGDFFDINEDFNGFNNQWLRYANGTTIDWATYVEFTINTTKNGEAISYTQKTFFSIADYNQLGGDDIKTYTSDFATELYNAVSDRWYIQSNDDTGLEATFGMVSGFQLTGCFVEFKIQTKEGNGISEFRRYSSVNVQSSDTYMKSLTGNDLVTLTNPSTGVLRARCFIDKNLIPVGVPIYSISASLWYKDPPLTEFKITEDGEVKITEDGQVEVIE